ncbi:hypothetical protein T459_32179 [Capsicum annuum]|uniref:Xylanase inhibitor C-terminal domain-containing protein n=1 Tax=Capsicum annuum TaxID=4072 RepID=A0A2G2Y2W6_CAPAN|nr:hypothetical protein T459_32179 [Capsicum annuum]
MWNFHPSSCSESNWRVDQKPGIDLSQISCKDMALAPNSTSKINSPYQQTVIPSPKQWKESTLTFFETPWNTGVLARLNRNIYYPSFYYLSNLDKITNNDREVPIDPSHWDLGPDKYGGIFIDTGVIFSSFPDDVYIKFSDIFRSEVRNMSMVRRPRTAIFDTCYEADKVVDLRVFPTVTFYFKGSKRSMIGGNVLQTFGLTFDLNKWRSNSGSKKRITSGRGTLSSRYTCVPPASLSQPFEEEVGVPLGAGAHDMDYVEAQKNYGIEEENEVDVVNLDEDDENIGETFAVGNANVRSESVNLPPRPSRAPRAHKTTSIA